ncbi:MAG: glycoside hydrolase [Gemmatimonadetes bacterium]|uniref:Glycoside hydrolase n=1 Tax=Candidatus Kutchimonas denitrificans TaxID=3056748 RepID=A0AAE5CCP5_9BACT|nr:glycoside hydrolase [Gemmatimonadota bacterium]NIR75945.1 glycoside hydrolase [Candidatus Kutchimonas denitrificans]NIS02103.1 glycoside hydrolase [Gemmatimonadota bacterium]NIT67928.1 glycoside hydrolase [Gemmatimonadota bacterium]NIU53922.1 glycoside hydrolase [Gemmatimonadota bacterium]
MLKKTYSPKGKSCRVTFELPAEVNAQSVSLCGEFNDWDPTSHPLKPRKGRRFSTTISLEPGRSYRFKYLVDDERWENDWAADDYVSNEFGTQDSPVQL